MSPSSEQFLDSALLLPEADRAELVEALIASFQPADRPPFDDFWREIVQRRSAELRSGHVIAVPWEDVKRQAREKLRG